MQFAVYRCTVLQVILHDAVQKTRYITYRTTPGNESWNMIKSREGKLTGYDVRYTGVHNQGYFLGGMGSEIGSPPSEIAVDMKERVSQGCTNNGYLESNSCLTK